jgi:SAM-dependent methyltransferase
MRSRFQPFWAFLTFDARAINRARQDHLASLDLPLDGKSVLEVGAGIGLHTAFFENRGCQVLSTDARFENVAEIARRYPQRRVAHLDLEHPDEILAVGPFDIVYCYGTLYHLGTPDQTLKALANISDMVLVETCVTPGPGEAVNLIGELPAANQAHSGEGCRPTRRWVLERLREYWGFGYLSRTQPSHPEFPLNWTLLPHQPSRTRNTRAVFVGSKTPLASPDLLADLVDHQVPVRVLPNPDRPA